MFRKMHNVVVYIDGFNLYYGMKEGGWQRYYWLDLHLLSIILLESNQLLQKVKYFTSRVSSSNRGNSKSKRQNTYLEAIETLPDTKIFYGKYLRKPIFCYKCHSKFRIPEEKMTDVNIATEMLVDAFHDYFDTAILVCGDSDLVPPVKAINKLFPHKRIIVAFPPNRYSRSLENNAYKSYYITRSNLAQSQLPDSIKKKDGYILKRPPTWK